MATNAFGGSTTGLSKLTTSNTKDYPSSLYYDPTSNQVLTNIIGANVWTPYQQKVLVANTRANQNTGTNPNSGDNTQVTTNGSGSGSGSGSYAATQAEVNYTLANLASKEDALRKLLSQYDTTEAQGMQQIADNYNTSFNQGVADYGAQRNTNAVARNNAYEGVDTKARTDWGSLRRMLGGTGGANESANMAARMAVARQSTADRDKQTQTYGANDQAIANSEAKFNQGLLKEKAQKEQSLLQSLLEGRNDVNSQLADAAMQKSYLNGANYQTIRNSANGYQSAIDANNAKLAALPDQYKSVYNTVLTPAELSQFTVDPTAISGQKSGVSAEYSPYSSLLRKKVLEQA